MFSQPNSQTSDPIVYQEAAKSADQEIRPAQRLTRGMHELLDGAAPLLDGAGDRLDTLTHRGLDAVRRRSRRLRDQALHASDSTLHYIRGEPVKAALIAAAAGAALMALFTLLSPTRNRG
jgi:hypothetical protein